MSRVTPSLESILNKARFLNFALAFSPVCYGAVVYLTKFEADRSVDLDTMKMLFSILGVGGCFAAAMINREGFNPKRYKGMKSEKEKMDRIFTVSILSWAMAESCAIFGLIFAIMSGEPSEYPLFGVLASLTILAHPASASRVRRILEVK